MSEVPVIFIFVFTIMVFVYINVVYPWMRKKRVAKIVKYTKENFNFKQYVLEDILILRYWYKFDKHSPATDHYIFFPVVRDIITNEMYISNLNETYSSNFYFTYESAATLFSKGFDFKIIKTDNSAIINIGDLCKCYITKVVDYKIVLKGNDIFINNKKYTYMGNIFDSNIVKENRVKNLIFNTKRGEGISRLINAKFFNGVIEF